MIRIFIFALLFSNAFICRSATNVSGVISSNETWTSKGSPYLVTANVQVANGVTLTIAPGSTVSFASGTELVVAGKLVADGTTSSPIVFTGKTNKNWNALHFISDSSASVSYALIENSRFGINLDGATCPLIKNCVFINNLYAVTSGRYAPIIIEDCAFINNENVFYGIRTLGESRFQRNLFKDNLNVFTFGYYFGSTQISENSIINNKFVLKAPEIGYGYGTVSIQGNYWGTSDVNSIASLISDQKSNVALQTVAFKPLLEANPVDFGGQYLQITASSANQRSYPRLSNLAVRTVLSTNQILIVGFTMFGGPRNVLLRAAGPSLSSFGLGGMSDPKLDLYNGQNKVTNNDNWGGSSTLLSAFQSVGAFAYSSSSSLDAALVTSIDGGRTVQVYGPSAGTVIVEAYDMGSENVPRFTNLSARNKVGLGGDIMIAGFTLTGSGIRNLLIRAIGPRLADFGVTGYLADPKLQIITRGGVIENDNWSSSLIPTFSSVGAFGLVANSKDAAIVVSLPEGGYTVQVSGADGGVGEALIEIYELP